MVDHATAMDVDAAGPSTTAAPAPTATAKTTASYDLPWVSTATPVLACCTCQKLCRQSECSLIIADCSLNSMLA
jgi:hypothetical protein